MRTFPLAILLVLAIVVVLATASTTTTKKRYTRHAKPVKPRGRRSVHNDCDDDDRHDIRSHSTPMPNRHQKRSPFPRQNYVVDKTKAKPSGALAGYFNSSYLVPRPEHQYKRSIATADSIGPSAPRNRRHFPRQMKNDEIMKRSRRTVPNRAIFSTLPKHK